MPFYNHCWPGGSCEVVVVAWAHMSLIITTIHLSQMCCLLLHELNLITSKMSSKCFTMIWYWNKKSTCIPKNFAHKAGEHKVDIKEVNTYHWRNNQNFFIFLQRNRQVLRGTQGKEIPADRESSLTSGSWDVQKGCLVHAKHNKWGQKDCRIPQDNERTIKATEGKTWSGISFGN